VPTKKLFQTNFIAGELAHELDYRADIKQYQNGARSLFNRKVLLAGGTTRRPGTHRLTNHQGRVVRLVEFVFNEDTQYLIEFNELGGAFAYFPDGSFAGTIIAGGGPWANSTILYDMDYMQAANSLILTHPTWYPLIIQRVAITQWSITTFNFFISGSRIEQPYFKVAPFDITMQPTGTTGNVTLTLNGAWFLPSHVGQRFRYLGRELNINSVTSPFQAEAIAFEPLPGSYGVGVEDGSGFSPNDTVVGADSNAKGVIHSMGGNSLFIYLRKASITAATGPGGTTAAQVGGFTGVATASMQKFVVGEILVGPAFTSKITSVDEIPPVPVTDWDEALISPANGYPACVALHHGRLCFAGHPAIPNLLMCSRVSNIRSFNVGDGSDADAIMETIGDSVSAEIRQLFSAEQLLIATDKGMYYVPEGPNVPFRPISISFSPFGSTWPMSRNVKMKQFDDGVIGVTGNLVVKFKPTGDTQKSWAALEVSILSPHLINDPIDMCVVTNFEEGPERYCVIVNRDNTLCVFQLIENQDVRNFVPWVTHGIFTSVASVKRKLYCAAKSGPLGSDGFCLLEQFDSKQLLDHAVKFNTAAELAGIPAIFADNVQVVTESGFFLGTWPDLHVAEFPPGPYWAGYAFDSRIETLPPILDDQTGSNAGDLCRIAEAMVFVQESRRFALQGLELQAYRVGEDMNLPPPLRKGPQRFKIMGWHREPTVVINQPDPMPLTIMAIKTEVHW
jgi:hypothetical protein